MSFLPLKEYHTRENGRSDLVIDLRPAAPGVYTVVIRNGNSQIIKKVIVTR